MGHASSNGVARRRLASDVADRILRLVRSHPYRPGDRLPTVNALAQTFSVTGHTVREALNQLEVFGVVRIRHGAGIFVQEGADKLVFVNPFHSDVGLRRCLDLLETRSFLEPPLAAMAARNATNEQLGEMAAVLAEAATVLDGSDRSNERLNLLNLRFHCLVAEASGNDVASDVVDVLAKLHSEEQLALLPICEARQPAYPRHDHDSHEAILAAVRARDPARAGQMMRDHVEGVRAILADHLDALDGAADASPAPEGGDR